MPATPSTSHAARAAMLAITSLATRTAPWVPFCPISGMLPARPRVRGRLRTLHIRARACVNADHITGLDEQRDSDLGARFQLRRLGRTRDRVALEPGIRVHDLELDVDRQLDADELVLVAQQIRRTSF